MCIRDSYEYSNLADVATFYSKTSLTVYNLFEKPKDFIREGDEKLTLEQALSRPVSYTHLPFRR